MAWATRMSRNMRCEVMKHSAMMNVCFVKRASLSVAAEATKVGRTFATREAGSSAFYE